MNGTKQESGENKLIVFLSQVGHYLRGIKYAFQL